MILPNVDYKVISFKRSDGVDVQLKVSLKNTSDLNENFLVISVDNINTSKELKLFSWINKKRYTLNELIFFAVNNSLCLKITDKLQSEVFGSYGACAMLVDRIFSSAFDFKFS